MTYLTIAALALAANLNAAPEAPAAPAPAAKAAPVSEKATTPAAAEGQAAPAPAAPAKASKAALKNAMGALLGPCSPQMAAGKLKAVSVVDGKTLSALPEAERGTLGKVEPAGLYLAIEYAAGDLTGKDYRQIGPAYRLTTEQAQALLGQKVCVFEKAP